MLTTSLNLVANVMAEAASMLNAARTNVFTRGRGTHMQVAHRSEHPVSSAAKPAHLLVYHACIGEDDWSMSSGDAHELSAAMVVLASSAAPLWKPRLST